MTNGVGSNADAGVVAVPAVATVLVMVLFGLGCGMCGAQVCRQRKRKRFAMEDGPPRIRVLHGPDVRNALYSNVLCTVFPTPKIEVLTNKAGRISTTAKGDFEDKNHEYCLPEIINPAMDFQDSGLYAYARTGLQMFKPSSYMIPAGEEVELYSQIVEIKIEELPRHTILLGETLGAGNFGKVCQGEMITCEGDTIEVAAKTLKEGAEEMERVKFLQEAAIMGQFKHSNVVKVHGIVTAGEPALIVLELLTKGDLAKYLAQERFKQVASGMVYLSNKSFVHRDLAARNILLSEHGICKIADFGLSRDLMDEVYYISRGGKIPVKWTAPEAIHYKKYSTASDVWSYGIFLYEIWTLGRKPYEGFGIVELLRKIDSGYRLPPPPGCPRAIYEIMINAWNPEKNERPSFNAVMKRLSAANSELLYRAESDSLATDLGSEFTLVTFNTFKDLQYRYEVLMV